GCEEVQLLRRILPGKPGLLHLRRATAAATCRMGQAGFGPVLHSRRSLVEIQGQRATTIHDGALPCGSLRQGSRCRQGREYKSRSPTAEAMGKLPVISLASNYLFNSHRTSSASGRDEVRPGDSIP